ncbi:ribosome small subunit-dependent GTPase A [Natronospora cellulosivora (SeqCode)]
MTLTLGWQSGAIPVVVLNKADLVDNYEEQMKTVEEIASGVDIFAVSAKTAYGIDLLNEYLRPGKTIVLLGSSGVGKSSFANALAEEEIMAVNDIREDDSRGRHTTTHRQLMMLSSGVMIIDTPGMRELGMWDVDEGLSEAFNDAESYFGKCKFSDCKHESEPNCAIKKAIENGELSEDRWNSYMEIKREAEFVNDRTGYIRDKNAREMAIALRRREIKKRNK